MIPTEFQEQEALCQYLDLKKIRYFSIPNEMGLSMLNRYVAIRMGAKLKKIGKKRGVPDLAVFLPNKILFIEMKRTKGSTISKEQKEWINYLNTELSYAGASICKGWQEAKSYIEDEIKIENIKKVKKGDLKCQQQKN